ILALTDVLMLCGLFYAGGGVPSGIGSLLVVAVAIANILLRGRIGLVNAAAASLGLLYLTFFLSLSSPDATNHYVQADAPAQQDVGNGHRHHQQAADAAGHAATCVEQAAKHQHVGEREDEDRQQLPRRWQEQRDQ
ncbi:hypothetical protein QM340_30735, partial [Pseudomonas aeruginosa]|nr:hypothetical protein [Pseudomonas aeruginosa]